MDNTPTIKEPYRGTNTPANEGPNSLANTSTISCTNFFTDPCANNGANTCPHCFTDPCANIGANTGPHS